MASPIHQFEITPIIPIHAFGLDISFTNSALWMALAAFCSLGFLILSTEERKMVPDRMQAASEGFYTLVRNMIRENTGEKGLQYFPLIFTVFLTVLAGNVMGLIPYSFTYTSHIAVTATLAFFLFLLITIIGIVNHGTHFLSIFNPPGVPLLMKPLIIPMEVLSYFIRPITHSVRLFANMMAGHMMVKVMAGFVVMLGVTAGWLPLAALVGLYGLELLVAALQAYVFALLTCMYLSDAMGVDH